MTTRFRTLRFSRSAAIREFHCGQPSLDDYLLLFAGQHDRRDIAKVYLVEETQTGSIAAYFALSLTEVETADLGPGAKGLPRKIGGVLLARLAVDLRFQGQGLGGAALAEALGKAVAVAAIVGVPVVVVDAIDERAARFYERQGFIHTVADPLRLFWAMRDVRATLDAR